MSERLLVVQAFAFHQDALGPLDQPPRVQRHLELVGQRALELSLGRGPEQAGHHPSIGLQGADLGVVPAPGSAAYTSRVPMGPPPTLWWKISVHAAIAAGAATVLLLVFGPALLAVWPLVAVIAWSRVQVGDHTAARC